MSVNQSSGGLLNRIFHLDELHTNVKTEVLAGVTTFVTMAYILFVNPNILKAAGMPVAATFAATAISSAFATLIMGFYANYPIAMAPGMGLNAFFTYSVVIGMHLPWQTALGAVFISGLVFFLLTVTKVREWIIAGVPEVLRYSIGVGIGLFIAFIGLQNAGIIVANKDTIVALGNMKSPSVLVAALGLIITGFFMAKRIKGGLLLGMLITSVIAMIFRVAPAPTGISSFIAPTNPFASVTPIFMHLNIVGAFDYGLISILFAFTFVDMFDNIGTLLGVSRKAGLLDDQGNLPRAGRALMADSIGTMFGSIMGTPTVTSYIESTSGVAEGGKSGLTAVVVAILFIVAIVFAPLVGLVPSVATAPVLILVGTLMMGEVVHVRFDDFTEALPAFLTIIMMPLTYSIAQGLAFGFMSYTIIKLVTGRYKENNAVTYVLTILFILHFVLG
ncbi:Purine permease PbuG-like [Acididesulfobacillus acetoxydans]|uniref:Guanine/hypoxanthine permease PbuG n=1 Tax=Acididesulfobacillus acetoxydans TaxID=1561005 RepID=A0A8S0XD00_9FIRM|nr:NCS2 family permease [Acididesulfobacillus acetoxydans]CAA7602976.1 Purine permease PbuG-like [Acididesulfobacillus acetoxydans]CEJ05858.1 Guanine/hypoxanthine permease PbuG [Acididesulfobacillus acetoxydans]